MNFSKIKISLDFAGFFGILAFVTLAKMFQESKFLIPLIETKLNNSKSIILKSMSSIKIDQNSKFTTNLDQYFEKMEENSILILTI